jgi:hypothetical protein
MPNFPTLVTFLADVQKAFQAADQVQDVVNRLEMLRRQLKNSTQSSYRLSDKLGWTEKPHLTISTLLGITGRCWSLGLAARSSLVTTSLR